MKIPIVNNNKEFSNIDYTKKKSLRADLKLSQLNSLKNIKNQNLNVNNKLPFKKDPKSEFTDNIYNSESKFNDEIITGNKIKIKNIRIKQKENKEEKNDKKENPQDDDIKLRRIYVDLNENSIFNQESAEIISRQKNNFNNNSIRTCQYTLLTFLPLALFNQFKTAFNWFFLIYNIIASIPQISDLDPAAEVTPFVVVLILNLIKEAIEDYRKYVNDKKANGAKVLIFKENKFHKERCENIRVGNILKIYKEDLIPADLLIIKTSSNGLAYMQTANLDGENTLKVREAFNETQNVINNKLKTIKDTFEIKDDNFYVEVIPPNKNIYDIKGTTIYKGNKYHINIKNVLLRGARLKNVDYVYGIVIYNGHDTKLMQNIEHSSMKLSTIDVKLNYIITIIFLIYLLIIITTSVLGLNIRARRLPNYEKDEPKSEYIFYYEVNNTMHALEITRIISNNFLIFNTLIPVSIFIAFTICKIVQTMYLQEFSPEYRQSQGDNIKCFSSGLLDELGMTKYIFSDKTGTLTLNEMIFRGCSIYNQIFDDSTNNNNNNSVATETAIAHNLFNVPYSQSFVPSTPSKKNFSGNESTKGWTNQSKLTAPKVSDNFPLSTLMQYLHNYESTNYYNIGGIPFTYKNEPFVQFVLNITLNHDVLVETNSKNIINFQGASPDEITLVTAAYEFGYRFKSREKGIIKIEIYDNDRNRMREKEFKVLQKFDFTSERQCSSIVVEDLSTNQITFYIKGSDRKMFSILDNYSQHNIYPKTKLHLDKFAKQGLRTLCFGYKRIQRELYQKWEAKYKEIKHLSLKNEAYQNDLDRIIKYLESNVILLGITALEDKLQEEVEKDIKKFIDGGINFWMITGDKMDTAESIGYSCGIFSEDTDVYKIKETNDINKVIETLGDIEKKINKIDAELVNITKKHHEDMVKNNIIKNDEKYQKYRSRYDSLIIPDVKEKEKYDIIQLSNKNKERKSLNINQHMNELIKSNLINPMNKIIINNKNINNVKKPSNFFNENNANDNSINIKSNNSIEKRKVNIIDDKLYSSYSKNSDNDQIFKYVAQNVDNVSNYNDISLIQKRVRKEQASINSSEIFIKDGTEKEKYTSKENFYNNEEAQKDENKSIREDKKHKDIPVEEKKFHDYFDFCQNELYQMAIKHSNRFKLFKIKYLYPIPQDSSYIYKKITSKFSLILEGLAITSCMHDGEAADLFWKLITRSRSLICCRASPSQKSQIVEFVKKRTDAVTVAIGDGGNDVNMIRAASVGIGIFGKEGYQAAYNSDYAISRFKYLKKLIFNDGRISLQKNCYFLYHYFFKNFLFTISLLWFGIYSYFSGGNYYDDFYTMGFNTLITVIPLCVLAMIGEDFDPNFEKFSDKERQMLFTFLPNIFKEYRDSNPFNIIKFFTIFIISLFFSWVCYSIPAFTLKNNFYGRDEKGYQHSFWESSILSYLSIVTIHYFIVFVDTLCFNRGIIIFYIFQLALAFAFLVFIEVRESSEIYKTIGFMCKDWIMWLTYIITCASCLLPFYILRRGEFFLGGFIVNKIKQKQFDIFIEKFYQKKVEQMTRVVRNVAKFKRIYYNEEENIQEDNYNDIKMKKIVDEFKDKKSKYVNSNFKRNKSCLK